jgi:hypothetical protein
LGVASRLARAAGSDDVAESVPAYGQRMRLITEVEEYDKEGETGAA